MGGRSGWGGGKWWCENGDNCPRILIKKKRKTNTKNKVMVFQVTRYITHMIILIVQETDLQSGGILSGVHLNPVVLLSGL